MTGDTFLETYGPIALAIALGLLIHYLLWSVIRRFARETDTILDDSLATHCRLPSIVLFPAIATRIVLPMSSGEIGPVATDLVAKVLMILLVLSIAWTLIRFTKVLEDVVANRYDVTAADNLQARTIHTQFRIIRRIAIVVISILAFGTLLMSFDLFREIGTGILASAGIVGLITGLAAQKTLGNLFAGIQIALTQPIRIDDAVTVEGEFGKIEEITLTYVVVKIWDMRRLIVPISYFLEQPFRNMTRTSAELLGTVELPMDYTVPIDEVRKKITEIVEASEHWDGKTCGVQVTDATHQGIIVRAVVSGEDGGKVWNLKCDLREKMISYLRENHPESLPKIRAETRSV